MAVHAPAGADRGTTSAVRPLFFPEYQLCLSGDVEVVDTVRANSTTSETILPIIFVRIFFRLLENRNNSRIASSIVSVGED